MIERYGNHEYVLYKNSTTKKWTYILNNVNGDPINLIKSTDVFDTEQEASYAAIGHITLLEKGEI